MDDGQINLVGYPDLSKLGNDMDMMISVQHDSANSTTAATWQCSGTGHKAPTWSVMEANILPGISGIMATYGLQKVNFPAAQHVYANCDGEQDMLALFNADEGYRVVFVVMTSPAAGFDLPLLANAQPTVIAEFAETVTQNPILVVVDPMTPRTEYFATLLDQCDAMAATADPTVAPMGTAVTGQVQASVPIPKGPKCSGSF